MDYKTIAEAALASYDALVEKRNAFAGVEVTDAVKADVVALDAQIASALAEVRSAQVNAERAVEAAELRAKVNSLSVVKTVETATASDANASIRSLIARGNGGIDVKADRVFSSTKEFRAAPVKGAGGNFTNDDFVKEVLSAFTEQTALFRAGATLIETNSGEPINAPVLANYGVALTSEGAALAETTDSTNKQLTSYKYGAIALLARELVEDSGVDIAALVAGMVGDAVASKVNSQLLIGTGSSQPQGLLVGGTTVTAAGASAITETDLYKLYYGVKDSARAKGAWFMNPLTIAAIRGISSSIWQVNPSSDTPDQLFGRPVFTDSTIATMATGQRTVAFADPTAYAIRQVRGLRVEISNDYKFGNDDVAIKVVWRGDGVVTDTNGVKVLVQA